MSALESVYRYFCTRHGKGEAHGLGDAAVVSRHIREPGHSVGDVAVSRDTSRPASQASTAILEKDGVALVTSYGDYRRRRRDVIFTE